MNENKNEDGIKIIILGQSGVGKTNLINVFIGAEFQEYSETTTVSCIEGKITYQNKSYTYNLWDTAGQEQYRSINKLFLRNAKIILIVYSIDNRNSFNEINYWINSVKENLGDDKYIMALVANKSDLYEKQMVDDEEGESIAKKYGIDFLTTSALSERKKFQEFLKKLIANYIDKYIIAGKNTNTKGNKNIKIKGEKNESKKKCC